MISPSTHVAGRGAFQDSTMGHAMLQRIISSLHGSLYIP